MNSVKARGRIGRGPDFNAQRVAAGGLPVKEVRPGARGKVFHRAGAVAILAEKEGSAPGGFGVGAAESALKRGI